MADDVTHVLDRPEAGGRMIRGGLLRAIGFALGTLAGIGAAAVMFRELGVVDVGRYVTVAAVVVLAAGITEGGITGIGVREYAVLDGRERDNMMGSLLGIRIALTATGLALAVGFVAIAGYGGEMVAGTALFGFGFLLFMVQATLVIPLQSTLRLGWVAGLDLFRQLAMAVLIVAIALAGGGLLAFLAVPIPATLAMLAITFMVVRGATPLLPRFQGVRWRKLLSDILPYSAATVFGVLYFRAVVILVSLLTSEQETGWFGASFRVLETLVAIPPLVVSTALPILSRAARDDRVRLEYALTRLFHGALIVGAWMALAVYVAAELAIDVVAGPGFEPAVDTLRILGIGLVGSFLIPAFGFGLLSLHRYRAILLATSAAFGLAVAAALALAPALGADGGAIALVAAELALAVGYGMLLAREPDLRPGLAGTARAIVPAVILAALVAVAPVEVAGLPDVAAVVVATVVYFGVLRLARAIPPEVQAAVLAPLRRSRPDAV